MGKILAALAGALTLLLPTLALASEGGGMGTLNLTQTGWGYLVVIIFVVCYGLVMAEEFTHLRKSKPVILGAGVIWATIAYVYVQHGMNHDAAVAVRHNILEFAELFLFLLVAMTYINAMTERDLFEALRSWLVRKRYSLRKLFWILGTLAFWISPIADNLTTALLMNTVAMAVAGTNSRFMLLSCVNIVVAANAGGAFSPFGDITTLMVWQKAIHTPQGVLDFWSFFYLLIPSIANWLVPAAIMHFFVPNEQPESHPSERAVHVKRGGYVIAVLFLLTIITAVSFHNFLHLPPVLGMMTGLSYLKIFGWYLKKTGEMTSIKISGPDGKLDENEMVPYDTFRKLAIAEWDTLLFFYGVVLCVGGLAFIGYLNLASTVMYVDLGHTRANILVGILSAIVDNIPVMFGVLTMNPDMSMGHWLQVTLNAGVGGSLLSIGSAAGVALMGQARGKYTFFGHLKVMPAVAAGFVVANLLHFWLNASLF